MCCLFFFSLHSLLVCFVAHGLCLAGICCCSDSLLWIPFPDFEDFFSVPWGCVLYQKKTLSVCGILSKSFLCGLVFFLSVLI